MSEPFLSSDDYDERAHQLYNESRYDEAIETLRAGLGLYPHAVELPFGGDLDFGGGKSRRQDIVC